MTRPLILVSNDDGVAARGIEVLATAAADYGDVFTVDTPDAATITSVVAIRPSATTHSVNMEQRYVPLSFTQVDGDTLIRLESINGGSEIDGFIERTFPVREAAERGAPAPAAGACR